MAANLNLQVSRYRQGPEREGAALQIDPTWAGNIAFYELLFGTWLTYIFLVIMWERWLGVQLAEWRYVLIMFLSASFFIINRYFNYAPFYLWLANSYTFVLLITYFFLCIRKQPKPFAWKVLAILSGVPLTFVYYSSEMIPRFAVDRGVHEFWFMLISFFGFLGLILWRGPRAARRDAALTI